MSDSKIVIFDKRTMKVPVCLYSGKALMPSQRAVRQLGMIAREDFLEGAVVALPDIHDKKDNDFPTGIAVASRGRIFPQLLVSGVNCGMRMIKTPLFLNTIKKDEIDGLFKDFVLKIKTRGYASKPLSLPDLLGLFKNGARWVTEIEGRGNSDVNNIENKGNAFLGTETSDNDILSAIPKDLINIARLRLGFLGKGNHFLEMQVVEELFDEEASGFLGIQKGQVLFVIHCGSGGFGSMVGHLYTPRPGYTMEFKMKTFIQLQRIAAFLNKAKRPYFQRMFNYYFSNKKGMFYLEEGSEEAAHYLNGLSAAANFGYANRQYLANQVREIVARRFSLTDDCISNVYDMSHMSINKEAHDGHNLWVHRCGATRAFSADILENDSPFKRTGEPVFLPGSMGDSTYLCVSQNQNKVTFFSAGHGSGRRRQDDIKERSKTRRELERKLSSRRVILYKGFSNNIVEQDPECFKDIEETLRVYTFANLIRPILRTRPVAVLKG